MFDRRGMEVLGYVDDLKLTNVKDRSLSEFRLVSAGEFNLSCGFGLAGLYVQVSHRFSITQCLQKGKFKNLDK